VARNGIQGHSGVEKKSQVGAVLAWPSHGQVIALLKNPASLSPPQVPPAPQPPSMWTGPIPPTP